MPHYLTDVEFELSHTQLSSYHTHSYHISHSYILMKNVIAGKCRQRFLVKVLCTKEYATYYY